MCVDFSMKCSPNEKAELKVGECFIKTCFTYI